MTRGHSVSCADAVRTTPDECKCMCHGDFHGGPHTERVRALVWRPEDRKKYSQSQVAQAKRRAREALAAGTPPGEVCTDYAVTYMIDVLVCTGGTHEQQIARETLKTVLDPFIEDIVSADLDEADSVNIETTVNHLHIICALCVEVLKLMEETDTLSKDVAEETAQKIVDTLGSPLLLSNSVKSVLKNALMRSINATIALTSNPSTIEMLRVAGFATCPNVKTHSDVEKFCVNPEANSYVTNALHEWIACEFPEGSPLLRRRPRRKKGE